MCCSALVEIDLPVDHRMRCKPDRLGEGGAQLHAPARHNQRVHSCSRLARAVSACGPPYVPSNLVLVKSVASLPVADYDLVV